MSATWHNVYVCDTSSGHPTPKDAEFYGCQDPQFDFVRLEQRWNGNPVIPPVGIKADLASHQWCPRTRWDAFGNPVQDFVLVPRSPSATASAAGPPSGS